MGLSIYAAGVFGLHKLIVEICRAQLSMSPRAGATFYLAALKLRLLIVPNQVIDLGNRVLCSFVCLCVFDKHMQLSSRRV